MDNIMDFILASRSPRRRKLLEEAGYNFIVVEPPDEHEDDILPDEDFSQYVERLAQNKAISVGAIVEKGIVLACDTIVVCEDEMLGKPTDIDDARRMHKKMNGKEQSVLSGICLYNVDIGQITDTGCEETLLFMRHRSDEEIEDYLATGLWQGKAGGFGYQERHDWLQLIGGSESNIVGMPLEMLQWLLYDFSKEQ